MPFVRHVLGSVITDRNPNPCEKNTPVVLSLQPRHHGMYGEKIQICVRLVAGNGSFKRTLVPLIWFLYRNCGCLSVVHGSVCVAKTRLICDAACVKKIAKMIMCSGYWWRSVYICQVHASTCTPVPARFAAYVNREKFTRWVQTPLVFRQPF